MWKRSTVRRPFPLRYHLILLVAVALGPVLFFATVIVTDLGQEQRLSVEEGLQSTVRAVGTAVDREIAASVDSLAMLATSDTLVSGDLKAFREQAVRALAVNDFWYVIAATDAHGQIVVSTARPYGSPLPWIGDRDYIRLVLERGRPGVSDLVAGRTTGLANISVAVPVKRAGVVRHALFAGIKPGALGRIIAAQRIPPTWIAGIADTRQVLIARNRDPERYVGTPLIDPVRDAVREAPSGTRRLPVYDAPDVYAAWYRIPSLGWTVTLGAPVAAVDAPLRRSMWKIAIVGTAMALAGIAVALTLGRRISRAMGGLSAAATALAIQGRPATRPSGIAEVDAVARAMDGAATTIRTRTDELVASQVAVRRLVDSSLIGILVGEDHHIVDANDAFLRMIGYTRDELEHQRFPWGVLMLRGREVVDPAAVAEAQVTGELATYETEFVRRDGTRVPLYVGATFLDEARHRWAAFVLDLTERKRIEEERERRLAAEAATRLKDEFLAVISHELRTPLTIVLASIRMVASGRLDDAQARSAVERIERNTRLQARLIDDLLDLSRIVAGKLQLERRPLALAPLVEDAASSLRAEAERGSVRLEVDVPAESVDVSGDTERLQQIVLNLVGNAIKFTPAGGFVAVSVAATADQAILRVRDSGPGIAPEMLPHIFERFAQGAAGRRHGGLGLGLAIVRHLVEAHGGSVRAESAGANKGALFVVELPRLVREAAPPSAA